LCASDEKEEEDDSVGGNSFTQLVSIKLPSKQGCIDIDNIFAFLDTGSPVSFISKEIIPQAVIYENLEDRRFPGLSGQNILIVGKVKLILVFKEK